MNLIVVITTSIMPLSMDIVVIYLPLALKSPNLYNKTDVLLTQLCLMSLSVLNYLINVLGFCKRMRIEG